MEAHFYNYITVAAMLILYGVLFLVVESRRTAPHVTHLEQITYRDALIIGVWQMLAIIPAPPVPARPSWAACCWASPALRGGVHLLPRHPGHGGRIPAQGAQIRRLRCRHHRTEVAVLAVGCVVAFVVSLAAIRFLMDYVKRHNFTFFGIYRIALGLVVLAVAVVSAMV